MLCAISIISVSDLWKLFEYATGEHRRNREQVIKWLDVVYADLDELSKVWRDAARNIDAKAVDKAFTLLDGPMWRGPIGNVVFYSRLRAFYDAASKVLGEKDGVFRDSFVNALARVLEGRNALRRTLERDGEIATLDPDTRLRSTSDTLSGELALQVEIAKLQVLIKTFAATSKA
jgi:hypothetical protein